jgi:hypothetical protein
MSRLLSTERPWFRVRYMRTRQGIGVATGVAGAVMATGMAGGTKHVGKKSASALKATVTGRQEQNTMGRRSHLTAAP